MCGLFGFVSYGNKIKDLSSLTNSLAEECAIRGRDATGIAFNFKGDLHIVKQPKSAFQIEFKISDGVSCVLGHTRHTTQGNAKKNSNNHPFFGKARQEKFALAHNGVLTNDSFLRKNYRLPRTKIETDSYIAVQLLERKGRLSMENIRSMAESVQGSFSFSIMDEYDNTYLVRGDSPISILHFKKLNLYVYASTDQILWKALIRSPLFSHLRNNDAVEVKICGGDILKICNDGELIYDKFNFTDLSAFDCYSWWSYGTDSKSATKVNEHLEELKAIAVCQGYDPEQIDTLYEEGYSLDEIEEYIYQIDYMEI